MLFCELHPLSSGKESNHFGSKSAPYLLKTTFTKRMHDEEDENAWAPQKQSELIRRSLKNKAA